MTRMYHQHPNNPTSANKEIDTCAKVRCYYPVSCLRDLGSRFCTRDECKEPGCHNGAKRRGGYCLQSHVCQSAECSNKRSDATTDTKYCTIHECKESSCRNQSRKSEGYCRESHACGNAECLNRRSGAPKDTKYCAIHECKEPSCYNKSRENGGYCRESHACRNTTCSSKRSNNPDETDYCIIHECKEHGCHNEAREQEGYCQQLHACRSVTCSKKRYETHADTSYCRDHECQKPDCRSEAKVSGGYCTTNQHACKESSCDKAREEDSNFKELCGYHYYKQESEEMKIMVAKLEGRHRAQEMGNPEMKVTETMSRPDQNTLLGIPKDSPLDVTTGAKPFAHFAGDQLENRPITAQDQTPRHISLLPRDISLPILVVPQNWPGFNIWRNWSNSPLATSPAALDSSRPERTLRRNSTMPSFPH